MRISSTQELIPDYTFVDDDSGSGLNARINTDIQAGTYWIGVSSAFAGEQGDWSLSINSVTLSTDSSFETIDSPLGIPVQVNPNPNIFGELEEGDLLFEGAFLDIYQFEVGITTSLQFDLASLQFDTMLILVDIVEGGNLGNLVLIDDDSGQSTNSRIQQTLEPGTYWMGITSFFEGETGAYEIDVSVITD